MRKLVLIVKREYLTRVKTKGFVIGTGGGTLDVANASGAITLDDAGQFALAAGATLTKTGAGVLTVGNNYDTSVGAGSSVLVNAGILRLQNANALGGTNKAGITLAGGTLDLRLNSGGTFGNNVTVTADSTISTGRTTAASTNITQVLGTPSECERQRPDLGFPEGMADFVPGTPLDAMLTRTYRKTFGD